MSTAAEARTLLPSPFVRDVVVSAFASAAIMVSLVLVTGWLAAGLGPVAFGVYGLSRRFLSTVNSVSPGPVGVGLARALAVSDDEHDRRAHLRAATVLALIPALALLLLAALAPGAPAQLVFSDRRYAAVFQASAVMVLGNSIFAVLFSWLRGTSRLRLANLWQIWALGLGPVLVAATLARSGRLPLILLLTAAASGAAAIPLARWLRAPENRPIGAAQVRERIRWLWRYTWPRLPAGLAYTGMFAIGPFLAPYFAGLRHAGFLVAGQSVLRIVESGTAGFGLVVLPKVAALQAKQQVGALRDRVEDVLGLILHFGLFATCQLAIWAPEIVANWLGGSYGEAVPLVRLVILGAVPYLGYTMLRSIIDGVDERAINARNIYRAFAVTAALSVLFGAAGLGAAGLAAAGTAGVLTLGVMSVRYLRASMGVGLGPTGLGLALGLNLLAAGIAAGFRSALPGAMPSLGRLAVGVGLGGVLLAGYVMVLRARRLRWVVELERRLLSPRPPRTGRP